MERLLLEDETYRDLLSRVENNTNINTTNTTNSSGASVNSDSESESQSSCPSSHNIISKLNSIQHKYTHDYKIHTCVDRYILERRIQYVLDMIEHQTIPDTDYHELLYGHGLGLGLGKQHPKHSKHSKKTKKTRQLIKDYLEVPYEAIPEYAMLVRHPISIETLQNKLQSHEYSAFSCFAADFYEMLNNGRSISTSDSDVSTIDIYVYTCICIPVYLSMYMYVYCYKYNYSTPILTSLFSFIPLTTSIHL